MEARTPAQIRTSVEETRRELTYSLNDLQGKFSELADWRRQLRERRTAAVISAAVAGFLVGGGVAATVGLLRRRG